MRFSWSGLILAPLLVPLVFSAMMLNVEAGWPVLAFAILLVSASIMSYGTTIFLFLPSLFLLSLWRPMNRHPALGYCWSMMFSENRYPLFGIML